jgi:hypothetical protein
MLRLPSRFAAVILCFAPLFRERSWRHAEVLLIGAILAPGQRTVTSILRITGLCRERRFTNYHRVLNRAAWSGRAAGRVLLGLLLDAFAPKGPVILGLDDTIERRRGKRIGAKGIYRDPVRSSKGHFVKASGLRWLSLMLLVPIPWAGRVWALPFLTVLAPSERHCRERGRRHKKLTDWGRQLVLQARRWMPERPLVLVADSGFAALELPAALVRRGVTCVTRLRLDAALYAPAPPRRPGAVGRPRTKGARLPTLSEAPCCMGRRCGALSPTRVPGHAMRTYSGRPRSSMRFSTSAAIATSVACRPSVWKRSPSPMTRFQREMSDSTRARQPYPEARCQPMRPRSAIHRRCASRCVGAVSAASLGTAFARGGTTTAASGCRAATSA